MKDFCLNTFWTSQTSYTGMGLYMFGPRLALNEVLRCCEGSLVVMAPCCRSFTVMFLGLVFRVLFCLRVSTRQENQKGLTFWPVFCTCYFHTGWCHHRSRYTSGRTIFYPYGYRRHPFVEHGNILACRCVLLIVIAAWRKLRFVLEQPSNSFLPELPRFQWLLSVVKDSYLGGQTETFVLNTLYIFIFIF